MKNINNTTFTDNGCLTNISTLNKNLDFFYIAPTLRNKNENLLLKLFKDALNEDKTTALRILFYIRDVRGGQGERNIFRICLLHLINKETNWLKNNLHLISEYGRYDDLLILLKSKIKDTVLNYIKVQLDEDLKNYEANKNISLLAKWLPSENSQKLFNKQYYNILINSKLFGTHKQYRKTISKLRQYLNILETKLCNKDYTNLDYSKLSGYNIFKYKKAFTRNDNDRYSTYLNSVEKGNTKINSNVLYPYDLVRGYISGSNWTNPISNKIDNTIEAQWKALPDYVPEINGLVVCDTSGSMLGLPICVAMSLAIYIAERNKSVTWKDYVIPFSSDANWQKVTGETLLDKLNSIYTGDCSDTNLEAVFDLILSRAIYFNVKDIDMPKQLLIISDMQFNSNTHNLASLDMIKLKYLNAGYTLPQLVWWNVNSKNTNTPATINDDGSILLSGCSPAMLKIALSGKDSMLEVMNKIINADRYKNIIYSNL